jgi:putative ABC transport system ATP-binding protein
MSLAQRITGGSAAGGTIVAVERVSRNYRMGSATVHALREVSLEVPHGQLIVIQGRSGSGKTTLLNLIGGLDNPTSGRVLVDGRDLGTLGDRERTELRRHRIGFIFQAFGLVPILTAAENVEIPMRLVRMPVDEREARVAMLLELVGLGERARHRPHELSGGEQQRVAIARSLANSPELLIADEPTGQLDSQTGRTIMTLLRSIVRSEGVTAVVATHDPLLVDLADRVIELSDGRIVGDGGRDRVAAAPSAAEPRAAASLTAGMPPLAPAAPAPAPAETAPPPAAPPRSPYAPPERPVDQRPAAPPRSPYAPPERPVDQRPAAPPRSPYAPPERPVEPPRTPPDDDEPVRPPFAPPPR